jgi:GntR family transcriptional regulator
VILFRVNTSSGLPVYLQLIEQVKQALDVGALRPGDQLPAIRRVAEELVVNPNTVAKAYRELEHDGVVELRQGAGAFVAATGGASRIARVKSMQPLVAGLVDRMVASGLTVEEIRRLCDAELLRHQAAARTRK